MQSEPRRVLVAFGTRPEVIKLAPVISALRRQPGLETITCASGQHREMVDQILPFFQLDPDIDLNLMRPGQSLHRLLAGIVEQMGEVIERCKPDLVVVQGDTGTALGTGLAAIYCGLPIAHVEAGLRTYRLYDPFPEEANRRLLDQMSSLLFAPTEDCRTALLAEGLPADSVHVTGNTVVDALEMVRRHWDEHGAPAEAERLLADCPGPMLLLTGHRRENLGDGLAAVFSAIAQLAEEQPELTVLFPVHRNPDVRGLAETMLAGHRNIRLLEPMAYPVFLRLVARADLIVTDSGGIQEEAPSFGTPILVTRRTTERQPLTESGAGVLSCPETDQVLAQARALLAQGRRSSPSNPFGDGRAGDRIAAHIAAFLRKD